MSFSPVIQSQLRRHRRRRITIHPAVLAAAGVAVVFAVVLVSAIVHGIPQLDPAAQMFVVP